MRPRIAFERIACEGGSARRGGTMMASANATFALLTKVDRLVLKTMADMSPKAQISDGKAASILPTR